MDIAKLASDQTFWTAVGSATALAAGVASVVTVGITTWLRKRNRPEPDWAVVLYGAATKDDPYGDRDGYHLKGTISNAGDGAAFAVVLTYRECVATMDAADTRNAGRAAVIKPGETVGFWCEIELGNWEAAAFDVEWTDPPTRLKKRRSMTFEPRHLMGKPGAWVTHPTTGVVSQEPV